MKFKQFVPTIKHLEEPNIIFGDSNALPDPKMGLVLLGPYGNRSKVYEINIGIIGDADSIEKTKNFIEKFKIRSYGLKKNLLHVDFPGIDKIRIKLNVTSTALIEDKDLKQTMEKTSSLSERVNLAYRIIKEKIKALAVDRHPSPDIILVAYPSVIDEYCIKGAIGNRSMPRKTGFEKDVEKKRSVHLTLDKFADSLSLPKEEFRPLDLRSMLKYESVNLNIPVQILRPNTFEPYDKDNPKREDDATTIWNLIVALFYKANNIPWKVENLMADTCYLGISFFRERENPSQVRTAMAQVFSLDMEGLVMKGEKVTVDRESNSCNLSKNQAKTLIEEGIEVYKRNRNGEMPKRIVIHKTSRFKQEEKQGFIDGARGINVDYVAFGTRSIKLLRWGKEPPIRGTMVKLPDGSVLLYTFGYIPYLEVYPGPRVPSPIEILEYESRSPIEEICKEILALTKLNWNNAKFCSKSPITVAFSRRVGSIIRECPKDIPKNVKLKFFV